MIRGEVRGPVKTQLGYHLIKVEDIHEGGQSELDEVKDEIAKSLMEQKQNELYSSKINDLNLKYNKIVKLNN